MSRNCQRRKTSVEHGEGNAKWKKIRLPFAGGELRRQQEMLSKGARETEHVKGKFRGDEKLSQWCQANLLNVWKPLPCVLSGWRTSLPQKRFLVTRSNSRSSPIENCSYLPHLLPVLYERASSPTLHARDEHAPSNLNILFHLHPPSFLGLSAIMLPLLWICHTLCLADHDESCVFIRNAWIKILHSLHQVKENKMYKT